MWLEEKKKKSWSLEFFFVSRLFGLITSIMFCIKFGLYIGIVWNLIALWDWKENEKWNFLKFSWFDWQEKIFLPRFISYGFRAIFRDRDKAAFGFATAQDRTRDNWVCRVSSQAKGEIHRFWYVICYADYNVWLRYLVT